MRSRGSPLIVSNHNSCCRPPPVVQTELVSAGALFQDKKQTASLVPQTGSDAFAAAAAAGPSVATVLGGPLVAGEYQPHHHAAVTASQRPGPPARCDSRRHGATAARALAGIS